MWRFAVERSDLFLIREDAISAKEFTLDNMIYYRDSFAYNDIVILCGLEEKSKKFHKFVSGYLVRFLSLRSHLL